MARRKVTKPESEATARRRFLLPILLFLSVVAVYAPSMASGFIYDDNEVILNQETPRSLSDVAQIFAERHFPNLPYYRPITRSTLLLQKTLHGDNAALFHLLNALFMALTGVMAYALMRLPALGVRKIPAVLAAGLFALHPIASSCVYPIASGRETLLPSLLTLLAVYGFLRKGTGWYVLAIAAFGASLFSKEQAVVVPALFVLADFFRISPNPPGWNLWRWLVRYSFLLPILCGYFTIRHFLFTRTEYALGDWTGPFLSLSYAFQTLVLPFLELVYEPTLAIWLSLPRLLVGGLFATGLAIAAVRLGRDHRPIILFWTGWFLVNLLPTANLLHQEAKYDERYVFLASLGVFGILGSVASKHWGQPDKARLWTALGVLLVIAAAAVSLHRGSYFKDNLSFSKQWMKTDPDSVNAYYNMGYALAQKGKFEDAVPFYLKSLEIRPNYSYAHNNLANALIELGEFDRAYLHFTEALKVDPGYEQAHQNLAIALAQRNRFDEAIKHFSEAVRLRPDFADAQNNLANVLAVQGLLNEAAFHFARTVELRPESPEAHNNLAHTLVRQGKLREALEHYSETLRLRPDHVEARQKIQVVLALLQNQS